MSIGIIGEWAIYHREVEGCELMIISAKVAVFLNLLLGFMINVKSGNLAWT